MVNDRQNKPPEAKKPKNIYMVKTPWFIKKMYPNYLWSVDTKEKILYLTFDDGPHPDATIFVLKQLKLYNAHATFFCIGKNVVAYPEIYNQIIHEGHAPGNHTFNHLNGWKTNDDIYLNDIAEATQCINSNLYRPPYGRITSFQAKNLVKVMKDKVPKIVMWDVLSADFDASITPQNCLANAVLKSGPGSIIVFHDSAKALPNLQYALPRLLKYFTEKGYVFNSL